MSNIKKLDWYWRSGGAAEHAGLTLLKEGRAYWDFGRASQGDGEAFNTINDLSPSGINLTAANSPLVKLRNINGNQVKAFTDITDKSFNTNDNGASIGSSSFEFYCAVSGDDGGQSMQFYGGRTATNREFQIYLSAPGLLAIAWGYTGTRFVWRATSAVIPAGAFGLTLLRIVCDFENDIVKIFSNGALIAGNYQSGTIVGKDPSLYDGTYDMYVGSTNIIGTLTQNTTNNYIHDMAFTGLQTDENAALISEYLTLGKYE